MTQNSTKSDNAPQHDAVQVASPESSAAGKTSHHPWKRKFAALLGMVAILGLGWLTNYAFWRVNLKRFAIVEEGVLIRSGQPTEFGLKHLVRHYGIKTVLSLRQEDDIIRIGALDGGEPSGRHESTVVNELKANYVHWPMGGEAYWPWLPPKQFEEFFELFDNPGNLPVAVHCVAGRHRTGTLSALYRLEFDRWSVKQALAEIQEFDFGEPVPVQLVNLRTYAPRPRPAEEQWPEIHARYSDFAPNAIDYDSLIHELAATSDQAALAQAIVHDVTEESVFAFAIARRLIHRLDAGSQQQVAQQAAQKIDSCLRAGERQVGPPICEADLESAAALVADFGTSSAQQRLVELLRRAQEVDSPIRFDDYTAAVRGVGDRYTPNRMAYLRVLLEDKRPLPGPGAGGYRFCDMAVARLTTIVNVRFVDELPPVEGMWDRAVASAAAWCAEHDEAQQLTQRLPPIEHRMAMDSLRLDQDGGDRFR